jgi:DNA-binding MarR family transcriptional regulator
LVNIADVIDQKTDMPPDNRPTKQVPPVKPPSVSGAASSAPSSPQKGLYLRKQDLCRGIELMFFAYRDFTSEADQILLELGLGRAHHRVIYFVGRQPDMSVSELLAILKITKQSLSRVLNHLIDTGYIQQTQGVRDKRQRLLALTRKGAALEARLTDMQCRRFAAAYSTRGGIAVDGFVKVLSSLLDEKIRAELRQQYPEHID